MTAFAKIFLFIWFYLGWFGCVYCAKYDFYWASLFFPIISFIFIYFKKIMVLKRIILLIFMAIAGYFCDWLFYSFNLISFPRYFVFAPPVWLLAMWLLFAGALPLMETFFFKRLFLGAILAGIFGPLSYYAGASFQILFFTSNLSLMVYILFWTISFPLMIYFQRKII